VDEIKCALDHLRN